MNRVFFVNNGMKFQPLHFEEHYNQEHSSSVLKKEDKQKTKHKVQRKGKEPRLSFNSIPELPSKLSKELHNDYFQDPAIVLDVQSFIFFM